MATIQQIENFSRFAMQLSDEEGSEIPLDVIFQRWHAEVHKDDDLLALQASDRDYSNGERGRPVAEFLKEFDETRNVDKSR